MSPVFFDLGYPELALPHIRFQPMKAHVYAMMGDNEAALKEASVIERYYASVYARLIAEENYIPENYSGDQAYKHVGKPNDKTKAISCRLDELVRDTYALKKMKSDRFASFSKILTNYFQSKSVDNLIMRQQFTALMGFHVLQGDHDKAIEVMDVAIERGFIFIGAFKEPYLRDLRSHPGFDERLEKMQKSADLLVEKYYTD